jgi:hypothetical protein
VDSDTVNLEFSSAQKPTEDEMDFDKTPKNFEKTPIMKKERAFVSRGGFNSAAKNVQATQEMSPNFMSKRREGEEEVPVKELFWKQRENNCDYYSQNRIVEICYGNDGLIDFLDLLFTQFPAKRKVKSKFNYYFAMRKQLQAIESDINIELKTCKNV